LQVVHFSDSPLTPPVFKYEHSPSAIPSPCRPPFRTSSQNSIAHVVDFTSPCKYVPGNRHMILLPLRVPSFSYSVCVLMINNRICFSSLNSSSDSKTARVPTLKFLTLFARAPSQCRSSFEFNIFGPLPYIKTTELFRP